MDDKKIPFTGGTITVLAPDVLVISYLPNQKVEVKSMTDVQQIRQDLMGNKPYYPIVDMTNGIISFSNEAKAWVAVNSESSAARIMDIFLVNNFLMKIRVKMYLMFYKPLNITKVVTSLEKALECIEEDRNQKLSSGK